MKLKVGMYIRTDLGEIGKITSVSNSLKELGINGIAYNSEPYLRGNETKASYNIIDLIEVGDYVNELQVYETGTFGHNGKTFCRLYGNVAPFYEEDIKSIVTKECFESMSYKVD